jgi:hypothetical protein
VIAAAAAAAAAAAVQQAQSSVLAVRAKHDELLLSYCVVHHTRLSSCRDHFLSSVLVITTTVYYEVCSATISGKALQ